MYQKHITKEEIDQMPPILFSGEIVVIDKKEDVSPAIAELTAAGIVGIDTETKPTFSKGVHNSVSLLQIATLSKCYLLRINRTGMTSDIADFFNNRNVKKVGLALKDDLLGLMRLHRFQARNCVDIQNMVNDYGIVDLSLQKVFAIIFQRKISKSQRLTNWESNTLTPQQCAYAATDAWATLLIHEQLLHSEKLSKQEIIRLKAEELAQHIAESNRARDAYKRDLKQFSDFMQVDDIDPNEVGENDIRAWLLTLREAGMSPRSIKRKLSTIKSYWHFCLKVGIAKHNTPEKIVSPKISKPLPIFFKDNEVERAIHEDVDLTDFKDVRDVLIINMFYQTGMRRTELVELTDADVDLNEMQIKIHGKRNKQRIVPIGEGLTSDIQYYIRLRDEQVERTCNSIFVRPSGKKLTAGDVYHIVHDRMSLVSTLYRCSPHVLRHTFATTMLNHDADIEAIRKLLGHESIATTQMYAHTTFEQLKKIYKNAHPRA